VIEGIVWLKGQTTEEHKAAICLQQYEILAKYKCGTCITSEVCCCYAVWLTTSGR